MPSELQSMDTAPTDGTEIVALFQGGDVFEIRWAEERRCMLYGVASGAGTFGSGWEDTANNLVVIDEPEAWRPREIW